MNSPVVESLFLSPLYQAYFYPLRNTIVGYKRNQHGEIIKVNILELRYGEWYQIKTQWINEFLSRYRVYILHWVGGAYKESNTFMYYGKEKFRGFKRPYTFTSIVKKPLKNGDEDENFYFLKEYAKKVQIFSVIKPPPPIFSPENGNINEMIMDLTPYIQQSNLCLSMKVPFRVNEVLPCKTTCSLCQGRGLVKKHPTSKNPSFNKHVCPVCLIIFSNGSFKKHMFKAHQLTNYPLDSEIHEFHTDKRVSPTKEALETIFHPDVSLDEFPEPQWKVSLSIQAIFENPSLLPKGEKNFHEAAFLANHRMRAKVGKKRSRPFSEDHLTNEEDYEDVSYQ
jgi:hypothetical protein